ncbi:MAG: site-specific DNA-methyltransferase [Clostridia bacterium]|nr:site-specific DNA-methyltransferase [Clostridia bacterium]
MSTNLSSEKREIILNNIKIMREKLQDEPELVTTLNEIEHELKRKKYGLVWENHEEKIDQEIKDKIPVFVEDSNLEIKIDETKSTNFILEGDNLHSLYLLEKTHRNRIDLIIIDPPYNRGLNDFIYDDNYIDKGDSFKHSKWISFMNKRLYMAKKLLKDNGVIFINIDDNELAGLKLLCDDIFGEENFVACFPWHNRTSVQNDTDISINHEYILAYAKKRRIANRRLKASNEDLWYKTDDFVIQPKETDSSKYANPDNDPRGLWKADPFDAPNIRPNLTYEIVNPVTGVKYLPPKGRCWRTEQEKFQKLLEDKRIVFGKNGRSKPQLKVFYNEVKMKGEIRNSWFDSDLYDTSTNGKKELLSILPDKKIFNTPKPVALYKEIIKMAISPKVKNPIILDFFAGSGTVGQAVLEEFQGKDASFILCNSNESNICKDITYERIKRIITGYENQKKENVKGIESNLKYYKINYIDKMRAEDESYYVENELQKFLKELIQLDNMNSTDNGLIELLLSDDDIDEFFGNKQRLNKCKIVYISSNALITEEQIEEFEKRNIEVQYVPELYYEKELNDINQW